MQFYSTVAVVALSLSTVVSAVPVAIEERQTNTISTITSSLNTLKTALTADAAALTVSLGGISGSLSGTVTGATALALSVVGNAKMTVAALMVSGNTISTVTSAAIQSVLSGVKVYTQAEIDLLTKDVTMAVALVKALKIQNTLSSTDLTPAAKLLVGTELSAAMAAVTLVTAPLSTFASAVQSAAKPSGSVTVVGLTQAVSGLTAIVSSLPKSL